MAVLNIRCPDCGHAYQALVVDGTRTPEVWSCSKCGERRAEPVGVEQDTNHPWAGDCMDACCR